MCVCLSLSSSGISICGQNDVQDMPMKYVRIDGSLKLAERDEVVRAFQHDPSVKICLISTFAGSEGLTLTAGNHVFMYVSAMSVYCALHVAFSLTD